MDRLGSEDPRWIGGYRLLSRLGEGGMGRVFLARSDRGRTVAVKVVKAELAQQPDFRRRFAQEIRAARKVGMGSPEGAARGEEWTAPVLDADTTAAEPWVATGYIAGPSLAQVVDQDYGPLPEHSVRALATGLIGALSAIHGAGLIHRDLKPSNILLTIDGPRVIDFGIARAMDAALQSSGGLTSTGAVIGSPGFMSPEQVRGTQAGPASDVFCLGAVLAYAATGRMPFGTADSGVHALMFRIAEEDPDLSGLSGPLRELVAACLTKSPEGRPTLEALAARVDGEITGTWLPGEVLAQLGRHAVQLLNNEDPDARAGTQTAPPGQVPGGGPGTHATPPPPAVSPGAPATPPGSFGGQGPYGYPQTGWQSGGAGGPQPAVGPGVPLPPGPQTGYHQPVSAYHSAVRTPARPARSARPLATPTWILLAVTLGWIGLSIIFQLIAYSALNDSPQSFSPRYDADFHDLKSAAEQLRVFTVVLTVATAAMWVAWFWRIRVNAELFAPGRIRHGTGMAVGSWFIPIGNFFLPKQIANDVWEASSPASPRGPGHWYGQQPMAAQRGLLNGWWTMWMIYFAMTSMFAWVSWYEADTVDDAQGLLALGVFRELFGIPAGILALVVVLRLTRMQENRLTGRA